MMTKYTTVGLLLLAASGAGRADSETSILDHMVVTATRTPFDAGLASSTTITREDIERLQAHSIGEVLENIAGVGVSNNGGLGKLTSVFIRGTDSDHVLVLIDGVKSGSATAGTTPYEFLPLSEIERIEVVRGPRSSLYGSEAIGGVIQIFTRQAGHKTITPSFSIGSGSHDTHRINGGISGRYGDSWYSAHISHEESNGFNSCSGSFSSGCFTVEPDNDGYRNESASVRLGHRFSDRAEIELHGLYADGDTHYDGSFQNETDFVQQILGGKIRVSPFSFWTVTLNGGQSRDRQRNKEDGVDSSVFNTTRNTFSWQNDFYFGERQLLSVGWDLRSDKIQSSEDFTRKSREDKAFFFQYQGSLGNHDFVLGARKEDNDQFGHHGTVNAAWGYNFANGLKLTASYGTAYKAPTFNELYFPFFGNPDLQPERSRSYEIGLGNSHSWGHWSINAYQTHLKELIIFDPDIFAPNNVSEARIRGIEAILNLRWNDWRLDTHFSALEPENRDGDSADNGNVLPRRAELMFRSDLDRDFGAFSLGATLRAEGRRYDDPGNRRRLGGYALLDLRAGYAITREWRLQAQVKNLLDKHYRTAGGYNTDDTNVFFTLRYTPKAL